MKSAARDTTAGRVWYNAERKGEWAARAIAAAHEHMRGKKMRIGILTLACALACALAAATATAETQATNERNARSGG